MKFLGTPWNGALTNAIHLTGAINMDYKALLKKYIQHVSHSSDDGTYLQPYALEKFSIDEQQALIQLEDELRESGTL